MIKFGQYLVTQDKINKIIYLLNQIKPLTGDYAEVGVYKGGISTVISQNSNSNVYLFDTFEGMPYFTNNVDKDWKVGTFKDTDINNIKALFQTQKNVYIHKGIFPKDTAKFIETNKFKFVHLDVDNYISYKESLEFFYPRVVPGGVIVFDDYNCDCCPGANLAIDEFLMDKSEILNIDSSVFVIKN